MSINKDLNVDPYYDDYDESKQFNRILFTPAKAVQARELTQLQTILQNQVEKFGSNIYKEGTIISGVNLTARDDLFYVKLKDQVGFTNPSLYDEVFSEEGSSSRFILRGSSGLKAEIIKGLNGFETSAPDLKTFYITYLNTSRDSADVNDKKQFGENETLSLLDSDENAVTVNGSPLTFSTFSPGNGSHVGRAFAVSCEPGVIYQKGHFIFVDRQFSVVTRYSNVPGEGLNPDDRTEVIPISVGFTVEENIINSNQDLSLADNALGYNNYNAPGADRLQLLPKLVSFATEDEPSEFFALIRYKDGKSVRLRDYTQYSLLGEELARRTYEESGNYVLNGLEATLESPIFDNNNTEDESDDEFFAQVSLSPGKAYVYGKEVRNVSTAKHRIDKVTTTQSKDNHVVLANYDQHYLSDFTNGSNTIDFDFDGGFNYKLLNGTTSIGTCCISNVEPGKIYVYNVKKTDATVNPTHIGLPNYDNNIEANRVALVLDSNNKGKGLQNSTESCMLFDTGKNSISSISNTNLVLRKRLSNVTINSSDEYVIARSGDNTEIPIESKDVFGIKDNVMYVPENVNQDSDGISRGIGSPSITVTFDENDNLSDTTLDHLYYNTVAVDFSPDTLSEKIKFIKTDFSNSGRTATLGHPNVIEIMQVMYEQGEQTIDVTSSFRLVNNQNDSFYDISYIQLKSGYDFPPVSSLIVKIKLLERTSGDTNPGGYLTADSYNNVTSKHLVGKYTAKNLKTYEIRNCYDFRPYAVKLTAANGSGVTQSSPITLNPRSASTPTPISYPIQFANNGVINSTIQYYLNRIDSLTMDEYGNTEIVKGAEEDTPVKPELNRRYEIATIYNPGNTIRISGDRCITLTERTNKVYRMNDIAKIENKVDSLKDMVALSLSEMSAKNLLVTGDDGVERFKNGILTDTFSSYIGANFTDPQFNCAIDKSRTIAMPSMNQFPIDLKVSSPLDVSDEVSADAFDGVTTLQQSGIVTFINQPYATNFRNCVSNYYNYQGTAQLHPAFVSGHDIVKNPEITLDIDLASPILDLVNNIQEFIPLTREGESTTELTSAFIDRINRWHDGAPTRVRNFVESTPIESLTTSTNSMTEAVGNFITDVSMKPYLKSEKIKVLVTGLRPNTVHHFFFDEKGVDEFVSPAVLNDLSSQLTASNVRGGSKANAGSTIKSDENGNIFAVFHMPANTFFVGENLLEVVDVDQYSSIESGSTSYGKVAFRGYNFSVSKSELNASTRTVDFDTEVTSVTERAFQVRTRDPIAQTFRVKSASAKDANYVYLSDIDVYFKRASLNTGVTLQIRETANGYPSKTVLPFSQKILNANEVSVSDDGTIPTKFKFDNPVKLKTDSEYCFVVIPAGNSPEYLIHTCKVGEVSKSQGNSPRTVAVTNDWGDGALFTSTNDSAWKSYQDEDIKFSINRFDFKTEGSLDLVPNDVEILKIRNNATVSDTDFGVIPFEIGEIAYAYPENRFEQDMTIGGSNINAPNQLRVSKNLIDLVPGTPDFEAESARREFNIGDYVVINNNSVSGTKKVVTRIVDVDTEVVTNDGIISDTFYVYTLEDPYDIYSIVGNISKTVKVVRVIAGIVSHYNPSRRDKLHLKASSARENNYFDNLSPVRISAPLVEGEVYTITDFGDALNSATRKSNWITAGVPGSAPLGDGEPDNSEIIGYQFIASAQAVNSDMNGTVRPNTQVIYGLNSGASATITIAEEEKLSYFQASVPVDNSQNTSYTLELKKSSGDLMVSDRLISNNANVYMPKTVRSITSKSKQIERNPSSPKEDFRISTTLKTNISTVTPILDAELASLNAYQYFISDQEASTSNYISKEVILDPDLPATGIRVLLSAFRPIGTYIDIYARFTYADDPDSPKLATIDTHYEGGVDGDYNLTSDWKKLENANEDVFSSTNNQKDYRDYQYDLDESRVTEDYSTFQIRIVLRHATTAELDNPQMSEVTPDINIFPTIYDYKAIAVT